MKKIKIIIIKFKGLIKYYTNLTIPVKAGIWFLLCNILQKGIVAITTPIYTRLLSVREYGVVSVYYSWQDLLSILTTFGLQSVVFSKGLVNNEEKKDEYTKVMVNLSLFTTCCSFGIYLLFSNFFNAFIGFPICVVFMMYMYNLFYGVIEFWIQKKRVTYEYIPVVLVTVLLSLLRPILSIFLIKLGIGNNFYIRIICDVIIVILIGSPIFCSIQKKGRMLWDKKIWQSSMYFVIPLIPHYLSQRVLSQSDRIMINRMVGETQAGMYSLAYSVGMLLMLLNSAIDSTMSPWIFRNMKNKNYAKIFSMSQKLIMFYALCVECFIIITPELVGLFATEEYREAMYIVPIISISSYFIFMYVQFIYFEYYIGKTKFIGWATIISAIVNIILNIFFIRKYGYKAAAYTTLVCYVLYAIGHFYLMKYLIRKYLSISKIFNSYYLILISGMLIGVGILSVNLYSLKLIRILLFAIFVFLTVFCGFSILNRFEIKKQNEGR